MMRVAKRDPLVGYAYVMDPYYSSRESGGGISKLRWSHYHGIVAAGDQRAMSIYLALAHMQRSVPDSGEVKNLINWENLGPAVTYVNSRTKMSLP